MSDPVENNLPRGRLGPLNRVLLRVAVKKDVQFRHFGNPTAIDFAVELDRESHKHSLPSTVQSSRFATVFKGLRPPEQQGLGTIGSIMRSWIGTGLAGRVNWRTFASRAFLGMANRPLV